jgi:hypothetical protein
MEGTVSTRSGVPAVVKQPAPAAPKGSPFSPITALYDTIAARRFLFPIVVFAVHFLIVQITATLAYMYGTSHSSSGPYQQQLGPPKDMTGFWENIVGPLRLWDGLWYKQIAERGYSFGEANAAFWPILPWVMRYGHDITGLQPEVVGYLFANACFLGSLIVIYQLLRMDFSAELTRRTLWALALFPTAVFFTAVYTEAPFIFFASLCLLCARKGEWPAAGLVGLLAALTRSQGIMLLAPLGILLIQQNGLIPSKWLRTAPFAALPILGPVIFGWRLQEAGFKWRSFIDVQGQWNRADSNPLKTFKCATKGCNLVVDAYGQKKTYFARGDDWGWLSDLFHHPNWNLVSSMEWRDKLANSDTVELVVTLLFIGLAIVGLFKLPLWQSAYVWPPLIVPLFQPSSVHPLFSMPRFVIVLFPLFVVLAMFFEDRWTKIIGVVASTALLVFFTIQFSQWYWVS